MSVRDITVTVNNNVTAVQAASFGIPLILATSAAVDYGEYTSLADIVTAGFASTTDAYKMASAIFAQGLETVAILGISYTSGTDPVGNLTTALTTLQETEDDWYFLVCTESGDDEITELATNFISSQKKQYFARTTTIDLVDTLTTDRCIILYKADVSDYPESAWIGYGAQHDPGTITWKWKTLDGISPETAITETQISSLHENGGNTYISALGVNYTSEGLASSGEYIDVVRASDYIESEIITEVFALLVSTAKVPYTQDGINQIGSVVTGVLQAMTTAGVIATDESGDGEFTVSIPDISDISSTDRANRVLNDISAEVVLSGAIHEVAITINLELTL